jgi:hypothetical protein
VPALAIIMMIAATILCMFPDIAARASIQAELPSEFRKIHAKQEASAATQNEENAPLH